MLQPFLSVGGGSFIFGYQSVHKKNKTKHAKNKTHPPLLTLSKERRREVNYLLSIRPEGKHKRLCPFTIHHPSELYKNKSAPAHAPGDDGSFLAGKQPTDGGRPWGKLRQDPSEAVTALRAYLPAMRRKWRLIAPRECNSSLPPHREGGRTSLPPRSLAIGQVAAPADDVDVRRRAVCPRGCARVAMAARRGLLLALWGGRPRSSAAPRRYPQRPPFFSRPLLRLSHGVLQARRDPGGAEAWGEDHAGHAVLAGVQGGKGPGAGAALFAFRQRGAAAGSAGSVCWTGRARGVGRLGTCVCSWGSLHPRLGQQPSWLSWSISYCFCWSNRSILS